MKKKLITIFSLCATLVLSLCSVGMKKASAAEEPIMNYGGGTYYVSMDYYYEVLVPNRYADSVIYHTIFEGYDNTGLYYDESSEQIKANGFVVEYNPHRDVFCSFMVDSSSGISSVNVKYYSSDSYGTIWEYISVNELPEEVGGELVDITLGENLFKSFSYGYNENKETYKTELNNSNYLYLTNLMEIEKDKDILVSFKVNLSETPDNDKFMTMLYSNFVLFNSNFRNVTNAKEFYNYEIVDSYELDASGTSYECRIILKNPKKILASAEYFAINPCFTYYNVLDKQVREYSPSITDMYISFIEEDLISYSNQLEALNVDYTPSQYNITWSNENLNIQNNYIRVKTSGDKTIEDFISYTSATSTSGTKLPMTYGSMYSEEIHLEGNQYGYIVKATENGKSEFLVVYFNILDSTAPVISGSSEYTIPSSSLLSVDAIRNSLIVMDNADSQGDIQLSIKYDYYTSNYNKPGTYYVAFIATDTSGNSTDYIVKINVVDRQAPTFYNEYNMPITKLEVRISLDSVLVMSDILSQVTAVDVVDGERTIKVHSDKYSGNGDVAGNYLVVLKASDTSGNVAYFNVNVVVSEEMPSKTTMIGDRLIIVDKSYKLKESDFHTLIKLIGSYNPNTTSYTTINDEIYSSSSKILGEYLVEYSIVTTSGVENNGVFTVRVVNSKTTGAIKDEKVEEDGVIESFFKWLWNLIVSFFEWIGSLFA